MIDTQIFDYLKTKTEFTDLVGTRVYDTYAEDNPKTPYQVYQRISTVPERPLKGGKFVRARFQFESYGKNQAEARSVAAQVKAALDGFKGELVAGGTRIMGAFVVDERPMTLEFQTGEHRYDVDIEFVYPDN